MAIAFDDNIICNGDGISLITGDQIKIKDSDTKLQVGSDIVVSFDISSSIVSDDKQKINRNNFKSITTLDEYPNAVDAVINEVVRVTTNIIASLAEKISNGSSATDGLNSIITDAYFLAGDDLTITTIGSKIENLTVGSYGYVQSDITLSTKSNEGLHYMFNVSTKPFGNITKIPKDTLIKCISTDVTSLKIDTSTYDLSNNIVIIAMPGGSTDSDLTNRVAALEALLKLSTN